MAMDSASSDKIVAAGGAYANVGIAPPTKHLYFVLFFSVSVYLKIVFKAINNRASFREWPSV